MSVSGVVVVDKPRGMTSHDVVGRARRALRTREIGHAGTLDPMATGVLVLGVGQGTKLLTFLTAEAKVYEATLVFGVTTETLDADGHEESRAEVPDETRAALEALARDPSHVPTVIESALAVERARTEQVPPAYSAIHVDGTRAHVLARKGVEVSLPARPVAVHELTVEGVHPGTPPSLRLRVRAEKGYYVRSLARDFAMTLGTVAHLSALRRVSSGAFGLEGAYTLDALAETGPAALLGLAEAAARALPTVVLDAAAVVEARHGKLVHHADIAGGPEGPVAWLDPSGDLVAIGQRTETGEGKVVRGFSAEAAASIPRPEG